MCAAGRSKALRVMWSEVVYKSADLPYKLDRTTLAGLLPAYSNPLQLGRTLVLARPISFQATEVHPCLLLPAPTLTGPSFWL